MAIVKKIRDNSGYGKEFETVTTSEVTYDTTPQLGSFNPVTSDGVAKAISGASGEVPAVNPGDAGKVLTAGFDGDTPTVSWEEAHGAEYTAGDGIKIESNTVSAYHGETLVDKVLPLAFKTGADTRLNWNYGHWQWFTALKVEFSDIVPNNTLLNISIKNSGSSQNVYVAMPYTTVDPDLGGKKVKVVFANPDNPSNYIEAISAANVEITQSYNTQYNAYTANVLAPARLFDNNFQSGFNWHGLTLSDIQGADGTTLMYIVACASDGTLVTTGGYGPTNNMWTVGFGIAIAPSATTYALVTMPSNPVGFEVKNPVPSYTSSDDGKVLGVVDNAGSAELQWVNAGGGDQPLPAIPAYSLRFQFSDTSFAPNVPPFSMLSGTWSPVDAGSGIWDFTYQNSDWTDVFNGIFTSSNLPNGTVDIIGGNMSGVSTALRLFKDCDSLRNVRIVSPWGDGNTDPNLSNMLEHSGATEIYLDMSGSNVVNGNPYLSYMAHECSSLKKFTLENPGLYPSFDHILHDCFALHEATIEGFSEINNAEAMFTSDYNLAKITLTPTQTAIKVNSSAESMFYRTGYAVETIEYPFDLTACNTARGMFAQCTIRQLPVLLNTSGVGDFSSFCEVDTELRSIPYIDVTNAYAVEQMFYGCTNVQSGALALYQQLSTKATPLTYYSACFSNCGSSTVSGAIELAKIPTSYGGLGYEDASTASVELPVNDLVVNDSVDVTSITVYSGVTSGIVQWTVASTTTLPTVTDSNNVALKASVNNPASLTVGRTVQVSILNGTWVCAEFA